MKQHPEIVFDRLFKEPMWIIDMLPWQVPEDSRGQYFAVEKYYRQGPNRERLCSHYASVLLKLNCYHDLLVNYSGGEWITNPKPELLVQWLSESFERGQFSAIVNDGDALITHYGGDTHMSLCGPTDEILELTCQLTAASGLFMWETDV